MQQPDNLYLYRLQLTDTYRDPANWTEDTHATIKRHAEFLDRLGSEGKLLLAGRTALDPGDKNLFGIAIVKAASLQDAIDKLAPDPAVVNGIQQSEVFPFSMPIRHWGAFDQSQGYDIHHDLLINAPANKVFRAVTEPEHLVNWWPQRCTGTPAAGEGYNFFFTEEYDWYGKVAEVVENKSFHVRMTKSDPDWDPTTFGFDLEEAEGGVLVRFRHTGWPACNAHFRRSSYCWAMLLNGLKNYVEKGTVVPFEERE